MATSRPGRVKPQPEIVLTPAEDPTGNDNLTLRHSEGAKPNNPPALELPGQDARILIKPSDCGDRLGFAWSMRKKWYCLWVIFFVQVSMNLNTTIYSNAIDGISLEWELTPYLIRWGGAASFLLTYAFGCELWAPWSEEFGRKIVLQLSLGSVNAFAFIVGLAPNWPVHIFGRFMGGLSSAGGSVTLAVVSDMFDHDDPMFQYAVLFIVFSSVGGSIVGPIIGGAIEGHTSWRWCIWIQLLVGVAVQLLHLWVVPETRATVIMDKVAKEHRKSGKNPHLYGPNEVAGRKRIDWAEVGQIWIRPFKMFFTEPIVLVFSLLSGFSDALIFMMIQSFGFVYWQYGFTPLQTGLCFIPIGLGYVIGALSFLFVINRNIQLRKKTPQSEYAMYESRLWWLLYLAPLLPIGLLEFAFTAAYFTTPIHPIASMIGSCMIGIANLAIYMATIDYVLRAYGPYAASATGGNGWARDFLAGILTPYAIPMYVKPPHRILSIFMATIILVIIATVLTSAVFIVYKYGPVLRRSSRFAQTIANAEADQATSSSSDGDNEAVNGGADNDDHDGTRGSHAARDPERVDRINHTVHVNRVLNFLPPDSLPGSRSNSQPNSAVNSPVVSPRTSVEVPKRNPQLHARRSGQAYSRTHLRVPGAP
ncbi:multidrug transporter [Hypoxylon trugodes]|uniref:multidrug transporter n=1 Tax=Hypoxylon trugodes TaxID=326681 RepID=UPI002196111A|nr:multidrug transporter [Hypoxylon trugodes]KAI1387308.1 multidrug transporter [Hypoxylon trugodes]